MIYMGFGYHFFHPGQKIGHARCKEIFKEKIKYGISNRRRKKYIYHPIFSVDDPCDVPVAVNVAVVNL